MIMGVPSGSDEWVLDADLGERLQEHEIEIADKIAATLAATVRARYEEQGPPARRDAHPRAHGYVRSAFVVDDDVPERLAYGIFRPGASYRAWVRLSNGDANIERSDAKGDIRAMAVKVFDVPGEKILAGDRDAVTQDFIMINSPVFPTDDAERYLKVMERSVSSNPLVKASAAVALGVKGARIGLAVQTSHISSPLTTRYWSTVPYRLGDGPGKQAIKFSVVPHEQPATGKHGTGQHFLRQAMIDHLTDREAVFDFMVQPRTSASMSVEESQVEWTEEQAPFVKVATIRIARQDFANEETDTWGEHLSFNPWHSLPQHRPLGSVNRIRRVVYETIANLRRELNGVPQAEPTGWIEP